MTALIEVSYPKKRCIEITLNRPEKHNAFNTALIDNLCDAFEAIRNNETLSIVRLNAKGTCFSAGADLQEMQAASNLNETDNHASAKRIADLMQALDTLPQISVCVVQGACFGGALGLVAASDIVIASTQASFKLSEVRLGLIPAVISPYLLRAIGMRALQRYAFTAETFSSHTAKDLGLIHDCVASENLSQASDTLINTLLKSSPEALIACKKLLRDIDRHREAITAEITEETIKRISKIRCTAQAQEGLKAFLEKRQPNW